MKIVLDTNVLISGIFFTGPPATILDAWQSGTVSLIFSDSVLVEYRRVAEELAAKYPLVRIDRILDLIAIHGELHIPNEAISICEDPDDNKFIECAASAQCRMIVSGDKHLLNISSYRGIQIIKPRNFVDLHLGNIEK